MPLINLPQRRQAGLQGKTLCLLPVDRKRAPATVKRSVDVVWKAFRRDREEVTSSASYPVMHGLRVHRLRCTKDSKGQMGARKGHSDLFGAPIGQGWAYLCQGASRIPALWPI
jgi:hypothetical protein